MLYASNISWEWPGDKATHCTVCAGLKVSLSVWHDYVTDASSFRYLNYSVTKLRSQDTLSVIVYISRNIHGRYLVWNFVRNNWAYIAEK